MSKKNQANEGPQDTESGSPDSGKVLPFRRPAPQPTLNRWGADGLNKETQLKRFKKEKQPTSIWKDKFTQALQIILLAIGVLLALKNCGKI